MSKQTMRSPGEASHGEQDPRLEAINAKLALLSGSEPLVVTAEGVSGTVRRERGLLAGFRKILSRPPNLIRVLGASRVLHPGENGALVSINPDGVHLTASTEGTEVRITPSREYDTVAATAAFFSALLLQGAESRGHHDQTHPDGAFGIPDAAYLVSELSAGTVTPEAVEEVYRQTISPAAFAGRTGYAPDMAPSEVYSRVAGLAK